MTRFPRLILLLVVLCGWLPFLDQAFHIDDRIYLEIADQILRNPFYPYDYAPRFEGLETADAASHSHLPLTAYYLALLKWISGEHREWVCHLAFLVFPLVGVFGFYDLARRYVRFPLAVAALLACSPAFLVSGHTVMTDVPLVAFWTLAVARWMVLVRGRGGRTDWLLCALSLLAAAFISLLSLGLVLLMAAYWLICPGEPAGGPGTRRHNQRLALLLLLPIGLWLLWYGRSYLHYDRVVLVNTFLHMEKRAIFSWELMMSKGLSLILNLGGAVLFPLALWWGLIDRVRLRLFLLLFCFSLVPLYLGPEGWSWTQTLLFALFFSSGSLLLWHLAGWGGDVLSRGGRVLLMAGFQQLSLSWGEYRPGRERAPDAGSPAEDGWKTADHLLLLFWLLGGGLIYLFAYYSGSVRYLLPMVPPVLLLWMRGLERRTGSGWLVRGLLGASLLTTAGLSALIACADYQFAELYRQTPPRIFHRYAGAGNTVWFTGEWGYRYYLEKAGARLLMRSGTGPGRGDLIMKPWLATPWVTLYDGADHSRLVERHPVETEHPIRILDFSSHAGFYSTGWGLLPFSISDGRPWEWFNVFRVVQPYRGPVPGPESHF